MRRRLCPKEALFTPSFIAVCSANLLFFIASFMMVPVLPIYLLDGLHASKSVVGIILSAYMIGALVMRPISGFLADQFPRKMLFLVCGILFAAQFEGYLLFNALALVGIGAAVLLGGLIAEISSFDDAFILGLIMLFFSAVLYMKVIGPQYEKNKLR